MNWESIGTSGAVGFLAAIITLLGWDRRMKKVEDRSVNIDLCDERHKVVDRIIDDIAYIKSRVDKLVDAHLSGKS